jgi:formylglycine-generating enzyme required for sulfatase activity
MLLRLAVGASLIEAGQSVRFTHQLLQEYFASEVLGQIVDASEPASDYWPPESWWKATGREETLIILAGVRGDPEKIARWVAPAQPELACQVLTESGVEVNLKKIHASTRNKIVQSAGEKTASDNPIPRNVAYTVLGRMDADERPGIGLLSDGLPDIDWVEIPAGTFLMGSDKSVDDRAYDDETPQHEVELPTYYISRYPLTYKQYRAFMDAGGYSNRDYWTDAGWQWKEDGNISQPGYWQDERFNAPNQPVNGLSWYEAYAVTQWLNEVLEARPDSEMVLRLPTEQEWEKAARGTDGRIYPYGNEFDATKGNTSETGIGTTSTAGIFPAGESPYGVLDMSGNLWDWCLTKWRGNYDEPEDNDPAGSSRRVLRGGAFYYDLLVARCAYRNPDSPSSQGGSFGLRLVCGVPVPR